MGPRGPEIARGCPRFTLYELTVGLVSAVSAGAWASRPAVKESASGDSPCISGGGDIGEVSPRYSRDTAEVQPRCNRGTVEASPRNRREIAEVRPRCGRGEAEVRPR